VNEAVWMDERTDTAKFRYYDFCYIPLLS